jgi:hypothetical protein
VPGIPVHISQTEVFGSAIVESTTAQPQNIFDCVSSSACTSKPITGSKAEFVISYKDTSGRRVYEMKTELFTPPS